MIALCFRAVDCHLLAVQELEAEGNMHQAEYHMIEAKDWKSAVNMYRTADKWEDAYRIAKTHGGPAISKQVAYLWAKSLGGDSAVKLLVRFGLLEDAIDYATDNVWELFFPVLRKQVQRNCNYICRLF